MSILYIKYINPILQKLRNAFNRAETDVNLGCANVHFYHLFFTLKIARYREAEWTWTAIRVQSRVNNECRKIPNTLRLENNCLSF